MLPRRLHLKRMHCSHGLASQLYRPTMSAARVTQFVIRHFVWRPIEDLRN